MLEYRKSNMHKETDTDILSSRRHFSLWMQPMCLQWEDLLYLGKRVVIQKNKQIFGEGEKLDGFYYLKSGLLRLISYKPNGDKVIHLYVTPGNLFGEAAFFNRMPVYSMYSAVEESSAYFFERSIIYERIIPHKPVLVESLLAYLSYKVGVMLHHQGDLLNTDLKGRVCRLLFDIAQHSGTLSSVMLKITQEEMATALGLHRATLNRILSELRSDGVIRIVSRGCIDILEVEQLLAYAQDTYAL